jgi:heme-degrading monooxygenase HmoA
MYMIRHIVLFKIKPEFQSEISSIVKSFYSMVGKVDGLVSLEAGRDFLGNARSYDVALITVFRDRASFDAYQDHPAHLPIKKRMHEVREASVSCDYLIEEA